MFNSHYPFISLGKAETNSLNPSKRIFYKFYARHRTYLVTMDVYSFSYYGGIFLQFNGHKVLRCKR